MEADRIPERSGNAGPSSDRCSAECEGKGSNKRQLACGSEYRLCEGSAGPTVSGPSSVLSARVNTESSQFRVVFRVLFRVSIANRATFGVRIGIVWPLFSKRQTRST